MLAMGNLADVHREFYPEATGEPPRVNGLFPWWHAFFVVPNREENSVRWLRRFNIIAYLPQFLKLVRCRGKSHRSKLCAVVPGMIFVPEQTMDLQRREEVFELAHIHGYIRTSDGAPARLNESEIMIIRQIEAKLNLPPECKNALFKLGQEVRFTNQLYAAFFGTGVILEIASEARIGVEVAKLFGGPSKVYLPASEIEAM